MPGIGLLESQHGLNLSLRIKDSGLELEGLRSGEVEQSTKQFHKPWDSHRWRGAPVVPALGPLRRQIFDTRSGRIEVPESVCVHRAGRPPPFAEQVR